MKAKVDFYFMHKQMIQQGEHSTNYSSWSTYLNSSSNIKQAPICMQKNLFQNSYCYILRITPFAHNRIKKPKNLYQKTYLIVVQCWIRWVIQIPSVPWITAIYTASSSILRYVYDDAILKQRNGKIYNFSFFVINLINLKWRHLIIMYLW